MDSSLAHRDLNSSLNDDTILCIDAKQEFDHPILLVQLVDCRIVDGFVTFDNFRIFARDEIGESFSRLLRNTRAECSQVLRVVEKEGAIHVGNARVDEGIEFGAFLESSSVDGFEG